MRDNPIRTRAEDLREWRAQFADATPIASLPPRQRSSCVGVVHKIRLVPGRQLELTLEDGTGRLIGIFTGRSTMLGVDLGGGVQLTGTVGEDDEGRPVMRNPALALITEPYS